MSTYYLDNGYANFKGHWVANTAITLGWRMLAKSTNTGTARKYVFECTTAGTTHATTEPTWDETPGNTTADNNVVWTCREATAWTNAHGRLDWLTLRTTTAGDIIYTDDGHSEDRNVAGTVTIAGSTSGATPLRIYCVDKATNALSTGTIVSNTSTNSSNVLSFTGYGYCYGIVFKAGNINFIDSTNGCAWILESNGTTNALDLIITGGVARLINVGSGGDPTKCNSLVLINAGIRFAQGANYNCVSMNRRSRFFWKGGTLTSVAAVTGAFFNAVGLSASLIAEIEDVDLSQIGATGYLVDNSENSAYDLTVTRCKFPSSFTPISSTWGITLSGKVRCHHCSSSNATYDFREDSYEGVVQDETTIVRTGGASDGTTPQSWKLQSNTIPDYNNHFALESPPIGGWTDSTTQKTFTIECIVDSATNLQNDEVWMELEYPANGTDGLGAVASDKCAQLGTPADKTTSSETWTTTGMTNPNKFKCSVTATPGKKGPISVRVYVAKTSTTVYVDPIITES